MSGVRREPELAVVILNWNGLPDTLACLESLSRSELNGFKTIVVDNGSDQDPSALLAQRFPHVLMVRSDANRGFAGGMNLGLERGLELGADYVLLLNNDTVVEPSMLRRLVQAAASHRDAGIVSPLVLSRDEPDLVLSAGWDFDPRRGHPGRPRYADRRQDDAALTGVEPVSASSGEAMLVSSAAVREVGMLDESLHLRLEDIDWSLRMSAGGRRNYVVLDAHLWHLVSASSGGDHSPLSAYYHTRNILLVCRRHAPLSRWGRLRREAEVLVANLAHARRGRHPLRNARAVIAGWRDFRRGRFGAR
jgi:GT2 family glycosyltransferase